MDLRFTTRPTFGASAVLTAAAIATLAAGAAPGAMAGDPGHRRPPRQSPAPAPPAAAPHQAPLNVEPVGHFGGRARALAVAGRYAYIGAGPRLVVLDGATLPWPRAVGASGLLPGLVTNIEVEGRYAYVATDDNTAVAPSLQVIDISDPARLRVVGSHGLVRPAVDVHVAGGVAHVTDYAVNLRMVDVSDPTRPRETGAVHVGTRYSTSGPRVHVVGRYAYLAAGQAGLRVIDLRAPAGPTEVAFYIPPESDDGTRDVFVAGGHAYLAAADAGLRVIDVSDPTQPHEVGAGPPGTVNATQVTGFGSVAYLLDAGKLRAIDVSDPRHPRELDAMATGGTAAVDIGVASSYAWVLGADGRVQVFDTADPSRLRVAGAYDSIPYIAGVHVAGDHAYVAGTSGLSVVDVSDPARPREVGRIAGPVGEVDVAGGLAFATGGDGLSVIDVSDPARLRRVGRYGPSGVDVRDVAVVGTYAYVVTGFSSLRVVDVSDPTRPREVGATVPTSLTPYMDRVFAMGSHAWVACWDGVRSVDVSDPRQPRIHGYYGTLQPQPYVRSVATAGDRAYALVSSEGLVVLDASDPARLSLIGRTEGVSGSGGDIHIVGARAYVAAGDSVWVLDRTPAIPTRLGFYELPSSTEAIFQHGEEIYVADGDAGLFVLRYTGDVLPHALPHDVRPDDHWQEGANPAGS